MIGNRGVSHTLGFILTFGIIITSIGIVSTVGYDQLEDIRTSEQQKNADRAMQLLNQNVGEIQSGASVRRGGEIDLNEGSLSTISGEDSWIQVNVSGASGPTDDDYQGEFELSGARYRIDGADIALEGGALFRQDRGGVIVSDEPSLVCTEDRAMVSIVTLQTESNRQVGTGTVTTDLRHNESAVRFPINRTGDNSTQGRSDVTVRVHSEYADGWHRYLESDENGWERDPAVTSHTQFVCNGPSSGGVDRYTVTQTVVNLSLTR